MLRLCSVPRVAVRAVLVAAVDDVHPRAYVVAPDRRHVHVLLGNHHGRRGDDLLSRRHQVDDVLQKRYVLGGSQNREDSVRLCKRVPGHARYS
jgi:hypothetical protein